MHRLSRRVVLFMLTAAALSLGIAGVAVAAHRVGARHVHGAAARQQAFWKVLRAQAQHGGRRAHATSPVRGDDDGDLADQQAQYGYERTAPALTVSGQALIAASQQAAGLGQVGGPWQSVTTQPFNAEPSNYTDPFWSNLGAGFSLVGGRTTALLKASDGSWYAGAADGGVWRSTDQGQHWNPIFDSMPSLSVGALATDPADGSVWVGTGEANTNQDSYAGTGVYRASPGSSNFSLVGGASNPITSRTIYALAFDPHGNAYAATNNGLFRYSPNTGQWTEVLAPAGANPSSPYMNHVTSVAVVPGSGGQHVIAVVGWRGEGLSDADLANNGFYDSTDGGQTFHEVAPTGDIDASDIGRTTFAYSADGSKLYAIVQSPKMFAGGAPSNLQGIFVSTGSASSPASVSGPWAKIADAAKLSPGSATPYGLNSVGAQAWYNQDLAVDPANPNHVYAGLEEVFESTDGGTNWVTASPYWNYGLACGSSCPPATHPDQHSMMIANGKIVIGNDGGVYSRPLSDTQQYGDWTDLNATLASWQYYDARAGSLGRNGLGVWGGLQDNGTSLLASGQPQMVEPAGGDGFDVIVDPANANRMVGEYTDGTMYSSTDGGHSFADPVSPGCVAQETVGVTPRADCDPSMRFVTPLIPDQQNTNTWVTGGEDVWVSHAGWNTSCTSSACSWQNVYDTGAHNAVTALSSVRNGQVIYAAFVGGGGNPGPSFGSGIATNYGGTWHQVNTSGLPNRYIAGVTADPSNPAHAYAIFNGYSRRWIPGGGVGHVFETYNGGKSWQDISGNLPDIASDALVISGGRLALATDAGMYTAIQGQGSRTSWSRLGRGLPNASVNDVTPGPNGYIYAATHGRGIWRLPFGSNH
jgi:sugar lactone lactonase YvrE